MKNIRSNVLSLFLIPLFFLFLTGCEKVNTIINDLQEREANEIIVFLASKGIKASKIPSPSAGGAAGVATAQLYSISVDEKKSVDAMAVLNQNGLPRRKGVNLLEIFAKSGLVSSDREETIRYQVGLAEQIASTIRKIDGVVDADVELSFPVESAIPTIGATTTPPKRITASVYVKHQGIVDDPNSHLVMKIKRLVAGSITGLDINDVVVISDRSRFTDISPAETHEEITPKTKEYVSIWSIVMNRASAGRFRFLFFILITATIVLGLLFAWLMWKFYPILRKKGVRNLLSPVPFQNKEAERENE